MPIFEFRCARCQIEFEKLMFSRTAAMRCPSCGADEVERKPSTFGMSGVERQTTSSSSCAGCTSGSCASCR